MTDHAFEQDLRAAFRGAVDQEAPASLRASVFTIPEAVPAMNERRSSVYRKLFPGNRMVPIGIAAAAVVVTVAIGLGLIGQPQQKVGDPSPVPNPTQVAPTPPVSSSATGGMTIPRLMHEALALDDGRVLVVGGGSELSGNDRLSAELYDPDTGTWTPTPSPARERATLTLLADGRVLATGGNPSTPFASAEVYDPETGEWSATGSMTTARVHHTATLLADGTVLVAGGVGRPDPVANAEASAELYDPSTGTWSPTGSMIEGRYTHAATLMADGKVLVTGGVASDLTAELYDPVTGKWRPTGDMPQPHANHTATLLGNGKVLVVGGERMGRPDDVSLRMAADLYDPTTGAWSPAGVMTEGRYFHAATLLSDGRVLVTGGVPYNNVDGGPDRHATAEVYDPETGEWSASGNLVAPRFGHTATLLPDGRILLAGGQSDGSSSAEIYEP